MANCPHPGDFLIADPRLTDPNFESSVVLVCEHNEEGTLGLIINRPIEESVELLFDEKDLNQDLQVFWGGPVTQQGLQALHQGKPGQILQDATEVLPGLYFGGCMEDLVEAQQAGDSVRFFFGYAGWDAGQLTGELDEGAWHVVKADPDLVLTEHAQQLWSELMSKTDPSLAWMRHIPEDPNLN